MVFTHVYLPTSGICSPGFSVVPLSCLLQAVFHSCVVPRATGTQVYHWPVSEDFVVDIWGKFDLIKYIVALKDSRGKGEGLLPIPVFEHLMH